jgi:3-hydroxybutyryl-CoA dehydratase
LDPTKAWTDTMTIQTRTRYYFEDLAVGMEASVLRSVSEADIATFAEISGDKNPVHVDPVYAAKTPFKSCIAHGMLTAAHLSSVFGMELPGPGAIYVSQTLNFRAPVRAGDTVLSKVKVVELFPAKRRVRFDCVSSVGGKPVLEGEAMLMVPGRPTG